MSKYRQAARIDDNQKEIVKYLRSLPGVSVAVSHDDLLVGYEFKTFWFEVKNPETCFLADGITFKKGAVKESQTKIRRTWQGHYNIVTSLEQIIEDINYDYR